MHITWGHRDCRRPEQLQPVTSSFIIIPPCHPHQHFYHFDPHQHHGCRHLPSQSLSSLSMSVFCSSIDVLVDVGNVTSNVMPQSTIASVLIDHWSWLMWWSLPSPYRWLFSFCLQYRCHDDPHEQYHHHRHRSLYTLIIIIILLHTTSHVWVVDGYEQQGVASKWFWVQNRRSRCYTAQCSRCQLKVA